MSRTSNPWEASLHPSAHHRLGGDHTYCHYVSVICAYMTHACLLSPHAARRVAGPGLCVRTDWRLGGSVVALLLPGTLQLKRTDVYAVVV
jgi:hypothetical protein